MLRSRTLNQLREWAADGLSIRQISKRLGLSRNTVRKFLRSTPDPPSWPLRGSILDPFKPRIESWVRDDKLYNCETIHDRLQPLGYVGSVTLIKDFVRPLRPPKGGRHAVRRYETLPGYQMQIDWATFTYMAGESRRRIYGFTAVLSYSRMRFVVFFKRCDTASMLRAVTEALEYFGGLPETILSDRMKSVLLTVEDKQPVWNPRYADFLSSIGVAPRVCRPRTPQTKGKVERSIRVVKESFWPGVRFEDIADLNAQARPWVDARNRRVHRTTHARPIDRLPEEALRPVPEGYSWERFRTEQRRVTWDGFVSFDGVLYGLPSDPLVAGRTVDVSTRSGELVVWYQGQVLTRHVIRPRSGESVWHPGQFSTVPTALEAQHAPVPLGYQTPPVEAVRRPLAEYDRIFASEVAA
jgi:transposase